jgi:hypothetical protein
MRVTSNVASSWQPTTSRSSRSRQTRPSAAGRAEAGVRKWANGLPDGEVDIKNAVGGDEWVAFECVIHGTNTGPFVKIRHYYDIASLVSRLDLA